MMDEARHHRVNALRIHTHWRQIMRDAKVKELRDEIEILRRQHERVIDGKDAAIADLDRELEEAEAQRATATRAHVQAVDAFIGLQHDRVKSLEDEFARNLRRVLALTEEFDAERAEIVGAHARQRREMMDLMLAMDASHEAHKHECLTEFESRREELKNSNAEEYNALRTALEGTIEALERTFEAAHREYLSSTDSRTSSFKLLTRQDAISARTIEKRMRKLIRLQDAVAKWRTKIKANAEEWEARNKALRHEKDIMSKHYQDLNRAMKRLRDKEHKKLQALIMNSDKASKALDEKLAKGEKLLKLAELSRKMETENEKVAPFARASGLMSDAEITRILSDPRATDGERAIAAATANAKKKRDAYNKVYLDERAVAKERARLEQENDDLRTLLKQYLDGVTVDEGVMDDPYNSLCVVNDRLQRRTAAAAAGGAGAGGDGDGGGWASRAGTTRPAPARATVKGARWRPERTGGRGGDDDAAAAAEPRFEYVNAN
ncbi:uncharacterized protein MICPUCDRAFT_37168 [Micromonas pusilla CCMP1545]|uniref:Dynein regulatory complex subunit 2 n=1 Tax=Micromonas pusilla (strain CCMP1545) TaxID=564608 RepID=C1N9Y8_MICPC|nr:uncharacterized protein MICPUCDRAFT_37168 [Micromonas pusilla CCMP1545]EEH51031.1 predicted protein [Micromonas pusilla CCMP1545]|eukprot:XP_003064697.1 predicted protein [Micromonas pusilla CCMP1545]